MKRQYILALFTLFFIGQLLAQEKDSIVLHYNHLKVYQELDAKEMYIKNALGAKIYQDLRFVKLTREGLQVLNVKGELFFVDEHGKKQKEVNRPYGLCGTVQHYTMSIQEDADSLYVYEDETFYDYNNQTPATKEFGMAKRDADELFFINGKQTFNFTANYGFYGAKVKEDPRAVFYRKGDAYGLFGQEPVYDKINLVGALLQAQKDGLRCYPKIDPTPKYAKLGAFEHFLAPFELPDGRKGFLDIDGNEYFAAL